MRHIRVGLTLCGVLTPSTFTTFCTGDTKEVPSVPIDQTVPRLHNDLQAADANAPVPYTFIAIPAECRYSRLSRREGRDVRELK